MKGIETQDYQEQLAEKYKEIDLENLKEVKKQQFFNNFAKRVNFLKQNKNLNPFINEKEVNDEEYQEDIDSELSLNNKTNNETN